jgi:imidazolonepropionase-like amidohydrolase
MRAQLRITPRPSLTAVRAAWLFDGTGSGLIPDPVVVIDGATIRTVHPSGDVPEDAIVVDFGGATLLPGLVDPHVHLAFDASADPVGNLSRRSDAEVVQAMIGAARTALRGGVTTVRDLGDRDYLSLVLRDQAALPTVVAAGPPITTPGGPCHFLGGVTEPTREGIRAAVRAHAEEGVDVIKIMASGGNLTPGSDQDLAQFPAEVLRAAVDEAHRRGLPVIAHAHAVTAIVAAAAARVDGLEHVSFWTAGGVDAPEWLIQAIAGQPITVGLSVGLVPTPVLTPPPEVPGRAPALMANTRRLYEAGVAIVPGTDAGVAPVKPHDVARQVPAALRDLGFTPTGALRAVTSDAARACGLGEVKGRIEPGFDADLLAVDGDPLADPDALHRIRAVYCRGLAIPPFSYHH